MTIVTNIDNLKLRLPTRPGWLCRQLVIRMGHELWAPLGAIFDFHGIARATAMCWSRSSLIVCRRDVLETPELVLAHRLSPHLKTIAAAHA